MKLTHSVVKVSNITISRQWYSSLLFEDTSQSGDGWCSWKSGLTIISEEKWNEYFSLLGDSQNTNAIVLVFEVPSFDSFLRILSLRDDRNSICIGEGSINGRKYMKLIDPDMNIVVVIESEYGYATISDSERDYSREKENSSSIRIFEKKKVK